LEKNEAQTCIKNQWNVYQSFFQEPGADRNFTNSAKERSQVGNKNATNELKLNLGTEE